VAYQFADTDRYAELTHGQLIDELDGSIKALVGVDSSGEYGGIPTLDNAPNPTDIDDVGEYSPGLDSVDNLAIVESIMSKRAMAHKGRSDEHPRSYHTVVEYGSRYLHSTGDNSLHGLARVAVATLILAANSEGADFNLLALSEESKPFSTQTNETGSEVWTLKQYDDYTRSIGASKRTSPKGDALATGLNSLLLGDSFESNSDVCIVVSDFLAGAKYSTEGQVTGFNWQNPLRRIHEAIGDRLLVTRLTSQAQREVPYAREMTIDGKDITLDIDDYIQISERYRSASTQKAEVIRSVLRGMRLLELDSGDKKPLLTVPEFVFASPETT
jgi:hypothetical protein